MLEELNKINLSKWKENPNITVQIASILDKASWQKDPFEPLVGRGQDRGIRFYEVNEAQPYRPRIKEQLTGDGVQGNADFDTNLDNLKILSQTLYPKVVGNSLKSEIKQYSKAEQIDFIKESVDSLKDWISDRRQRNFISALSNDLTNAVICDSRTNYKDSKDKTSVSEASKEIQKGDVVNVKAIRRAIFMARSGVNFKGEASYPLKPIRCEKQTVGGVLVSNYTYIILLDTYQINQLKNDPEYVAMQRVGVIGDKNNLFTGIIGLIDGCPVLDLGVWTAVQSGLLNSDISDNEFKAHINEANSAKIVPPSAYAGNQAVSIGFLIGANALILAGSTKPTFYIDDTQDAGRKTICGADIVMSIAKARFFANNDPFSAYNDTDFATIGILSSKE